MDTHDKQSSHLSIVEAVETLSEIADMDLEHGLGISQNEDSLEGDERLSYRTVRWLNKEEPEKGYAVVRETFRVILSYLRNFYRDEISYVSRDQSLEGVKTMMVLVGEAAKKLDKYTHLFHLNNDKSVTELKEYKKLQEFYQNKIAHKIDEGKLGLWLLALSKGALSRREETKLQGKTIQEAKHVFIDLDSVKKDVEYELFFLRKQDGSRFFSPRLLKNMKLVSDFGLYFGEEAVGDPLAKVPEWKDKYYQMTATDILGELGALRDRFFRNVFKLKDNELVQYIGYALMALMMCSNPRNSVRVDSLKTCEEYFKDFQLFLRCALHTREYAKLIAYPLEKDNNESSCLVKLVQAMCRGVYFSGSGFGEIADYFQLILDGVNHQKSVDQRSESCVWIRLDADYKLLAKMLKGHQNAPLIKILDCLEESVIPGFDPLAQQTMPTKLFNLACGGREVVAVRMGSPVVQEYVDKASVNDEFKEFLRSCGNESTPRNILLINLQDRTSWKDHARCTALEDLQHHDAFSHALAVVTIAKDTDFYHQLDPYNLDNKAEVFFGHFKEHFGDEASGYCFPAQLKKALDGAFLEGFLGAVHKVFFSGKNVLTLGQRLDFIEIFDILLSLKIVDEARPDSFCLLCKDGVDVSAAENALLYAFLKLVNQPEGLSEKEWEFLNRLLHLPAMMVRERLILQDAFGRFLGALKTVETAREEHSPEQFIKLFHQTFGKFFKTPILESIVRQIKE